MRRVLVIGAGGLVGSSVQVAFARDEVIATFHRSVRAGGVHLDVTDPKATRALIDDVRPDVIVLAAAEPWVERCEREPEATRAINVSAAIPIAEAARAHRALFVTFSSEYVFDGTRGEYAEGDPVQPINEYGRQKVAIEAIARATPRHLICRTSGVFGWEQARKNFVCQLVDRLRAGEAFVVPSDQLITPTYAPELARALAELVEKGATGTIHVVGPRVVERHAFALSVAGAFGLPPDRIMPRRTNEMGLIAPRPRRAGLADDELRRLLSGPLMDPDDCLREMRRLEATSTHV